MSRFKDMLASFRKYKLGFHLHEQMTGTHEFEPGYGPEGRHPFEFAVTWGPDDLARWLDPRHDGFLSQRLYGTVTVGGLCDAATCAGTLELRYFDDHKIRYTFAFNAGGMRYRYVGEKVNIRAWNLPVSHTTCYGSIIELDTGRLISRSVSHFRIKTVPRFAASLRLDLAAPEAA